MKAATRSPLHAEVAGTGTPLVFVHAGIADSRMWGSALDAVLVTEAAS